MYFLYTNSMVMGVDVEWKVNDNIFRIASKNGFNMQLLIAVICENPFKVLNL